VDCATNLTTITGQETMAEREIFRIKIAESWSVLEFEELMSSLQFLRNVALLSDVGEAGLNPIVSLLKDRAERTAHFEPDSAFDYVATQFFRTQLQMVFRAAEEHYRLSIHRLQFASPGVVDIAGVGEIVKQIRIFLTDIYDRHTSREDRKIAREIAQQELVAKRIANAEAMLKLGKHAGLDKQSSMMLVEEILKVDKFISHQAASGKLLGFEKLKY
jgi:hypothetical protein